MTTTVALDYYDFNALLSRNGVYNFLVGARGLGKTYGAKKHAMRQYFQNGSQFIYLRRYDTELKTAKATLFADIKEEFPGYSFRAQGIELQVRKGDEGQWAVMGYALALSKAQQLKSVSFHKVKLIIFDEFIIEKGVVRYLTNEAKVFNDFYSTVDRYKDKTIVVFIANSISIMNPYFVEFDIQPSPDTEWFRIAKGFIIAHFPTAESFANGVYQTRFGQFIKGTEYADYAVGSFFSDNSDVLIRKKSPDAEYLCTLITDTGTMSVWLDMIDSGIFYIQRKRPKDELIWVMRPENMQEGRTLVEFSHPIIARMRSAYANGKCWFDLAQSRNAFAGIYKR